METNKAEKGEISQRASQNPPPAPKRAPKRPPKRPGPWSSVSPFVNGSDAVNLPPSFSANNSSSLVPGLVETSQVTQQKTWI